MAGPIYKMFYARWTEAWYALSPEQRDGIFQQMTATAEKFGVKSMIVCDSSWASETHLFWGVEEYPDMEAVLEYGKRLIELNWFRYVDSETLLGTKYQPESAD